MADKDPQKLRVYEVAREVNLSSEAMVAMLRGLGYDIKSHMSMVTPEMREKVDQKFTEERGSALQEMRRKKEQLEERRRKEKAQAQADAEARAKVQASTKPDAPADEEAKKRRRRRRRRRGGAEGEQSERDTKVRVSPDVTKRFHSPGPERGPAQRRRIKKARPRVSDRRAVE